jgi:diguanylate cyclase (GGDEF)-like protein
MAQDSCPPLLATEDGLPPHCPRTDLSVFLLLLVTTALSVVMLMVLLSLARHAVAGMRAWSLANLLAIAALPLFAARGHVPDVLSYDAANLLLLCAPIFMYSGFLQHLGKPVPVRRLAAWALLSTAALACFRYAVDATALRIALTSVFHGVLNAAIARALRRSAAPGGARYPARFAFWSAALQAVAYGARFALYVIDLDAHVSVFDASATNLVFVALGTLALPTLTLGAVMMANADIIARTTYAAEHDYLTGAWTRRAFSKLAERERERLARNGGELSVLVFDVDHFKAINDTHGHAIGDRVLSDIVLRAGTVIRGIDACARLGGEEFAVLLPQTGTAHALVAAERLRAALEEGRVGDGADGLVWYTVSVGVATLEPNEAVARMMERADAALYAAKAAGRNRVCCAADGAGRPAAAAILQV